jgi:hypothetical protein
MKSCWRKQSEAKERVCREMKVLGKSWKPPTATNIEKLCDFQLKVVVTVSSQIYLLDRSG